jgi:hypothetical protein
MPPPPSRPPNRTIRVPPEYRPGLGRHDLKAICFEWKNKSGCDVFYNWEPRRGLSSFNLFGGQAQVDAAVRLINKWLENATTKSGASVAWAKMTAYDPNKWYYDEVGEMEAERKQMFKEPLPEGQNLPFKVRQYLKPKHSGLQLILQAVVPWPEELLAPDINITPRDAFNNKLEALNIIRITDEVYITLLRGQDWKVEIQGFEKAKVDAAEEHYRNMIKKITMRRTGTSIPVIAILDEAEGTNVILSKPQAWWPLLDGQYVPHLKTCLMDDPGRFRHRLPHPLIIKDVEDEICRAIEAIRYEPGAYDFAIRLGCICLTGLRNPPLGVEQSVVSFKRAIQGIATCVTRRW